ncbi:MAG: tRNA guanosine(34) transglycosylase Tgt [Patescibacteria group bacterium]
MAALTFSITARDAASKARTGVLTTAHGAIQTPAFVPVGTKAGVKGVLPSALRALGAQVVLANTYHLYLQPGAQVVQDAGGLGAFMGWQNEDTTTGPTITDSGGFQVFSLGAGFDRKVVRVTEEEKDTSTEGVSMYDEDVQSQHGQLAIIDEEGVSFTSHLDGTLHRFTPERSVELQHQLGADIFFAFDECTSQTEPYEYQKEAMYRTHRWADRSLKAHRQNIDASRTQAIYGIGQGGQFPDLRRESTRAIAEMGFDGFGLGGSFTKTNGESMLPLALSVLDELPETMPVHGLGVGEPGDLLEAIAAGVDTFDCVAPTRLGRHGTVYTRRGPVHLKKEQYCNDFTPLSIYGFTKSIYSDAAGSASGVEGFTLAYVSHLLRANEMLGQIIASTHNLGFIIGLVDGARSAIEKGTFASYREDFVREYYRS